MIERAWHRHYDKGVPHSLKPYPETTLLDVLRDAVRKEPRSAALLFKGASLSYGELERQSDAFASALLSLGVRKGERVALLMPNSPQMIIAEFGIWKAGGVVVPINPLYTGNELEHAFTECGAMTAIVLTMFYDKVNEIRARTPLKRIVATNIKEYLPSLKRTLFTLLKEKREGHRVRLVPGDLMMQGMITAHSGQAPSGVVVKPSDPAVFMFSGGTTGKPKCAVGRHQSMVITGMQIGTWFGVVLDRQSVVILNMPLFHVYAQLGIMTAGLVNGFPLALIPNPKDLDDLLDTIKSLRPAVLPGVPTLFSALAAHPRFQKDPSLLKSIKLIVSGAASLHLETKQRFEKLTGARIIEAYGMTESMLASVCTPVLGLRKSGAVGVPAPDVEIRIVDSAESGIELASGQVGEILMRAPQLMEGYWNNPRETAGMLKEGWLHTGDLGYLDEDGFLFIIDRKKDLIKPSGFQVWPREVEEVIARHPSVQEVGVAGVPDERQGEAVKAWVVLKSGCELCLDELKVHCQKELASYKVPRHVEIRDSLPKSMIGKVLRRVLVDEERQKSEA
ncbi:MAG: long-chain fatty acid--CoA ligase [Chlorobiaceae bacterium]|nr:long-chain fatty acid--CoA ligase [Chlorobiaceae bacterium]NTW74602.1 long-chain fatty acid--CoA ligase [Chlorobiaceae bacterium]